MKKNIVKFGVTLIIEIGLTVILSKLFSVRFIELMFFTGIVFSTITVWFSSSGGAMTRHIDSQTSAMTGMIQKREEFSLRLNYVVFASISFLVVGLIFLVLLITNVIPPTEVVLSNLH
ncbi:hypothetical protein J2Z40_000100 [Cytobacillus eiseniae]|uniref:Uncharacterized protein n=1 Tax=Cytobacillus eiseniae TaxID=762947 RepID=A0ABS4R9H7_9BACI|nr:hypothetical protein [Cytobacillus eiseniae]MBP2239547.1 hypothetical protein [Cytobacillus eiseniae]